MSEKNKFGTFAGVFTPSILTILGVIMYMRMGWVVGNAGLVGTIIIVVIAHIISISTGLSLSSIATDKKVGAGGIYYILSRSMGIPIGGAIGMTLYIGTAFAISLYLIGFAESFNVFLGFDTGINGLRISGSIALLVLTVIALISTSVALKIQFFILAAIIISLVSIAFGTNEFAPQSVALFASEESVPLEVVFAIFFPAVTGFTAGVAMSGDLKDPKKSLPFGTIAAIAVGFVVYISLAFFLSYYIDSETLRTDNNILMKIALWSPAVVAGIWGATLSSALGGILGGPRILQAMSIDKVTPKLFGKGRGENNEPVNALLLVFVIAQAGILIGELDVIARVVSMFYLAAYGFISLSFFLESWANPDFQPSFKVNRWFGLIGFLASFGVMFKLDMLAMFGAIVIIIGIYLLIQRKQLALESGDVWQSVWENIVAKGLKRLDTKEPDKSTNWNPNIILFSGDSPHRSYLLELGHTLAGRTGIVTNFNLIVDKNNTKPFKKTEQVVKEKSFKDLGMFSRQVKVTSIFKGIEDIASTFGFSGVEPNTVMMGWPRKLSKSEVYASMTQTLLYLDYNLLYLDFDQKTKFGKKKSIDLWWRETDSKNAEMMLNIVRFIVQSPQWNKANIRVLYVNHNNTDSTIIKSKIEKLVEELRVSVEIVIINNGVEQKPFYDIIALQSAHTDLTIVGIPNIKIEKQADFIVNTNQLFKTIGSTLMVKASNNFNELKFDIEQESFAKSTKTFQLEALPLGENKLLNTKAMELDFLLTTTSQRLSDKSIASVTSSYTQVFNELLIEFEILANTLEHKNKVHQVILPIKSFLKRLIVVSDDFKKNKLTTVSEVLYKEINSIQKTREKFIENEPRKLAISKRQKVKWKAPIAYFFSGVITAHLQKVCYHFGTQSFVLISSFAEKVAKESRLFVENFSSGKTDAFALFNARILALLQEQKETAKDINNEFLQEIQQFERQALIELINSIDKPKKAAILLEKTPKKTKKEILNIANKLTWFGTNWYKNQVLAHNQAESTWLLTQTGLDLAKVNERIKERFNQRLLDRQLAKIKILSKLENELTNSKILSIGKQNIDALNDVAKGFTSISLANLFEEEQRITQLTQKSSKLVNLMDSNSFNLLAEKQNETTDTISINLTAIQNHIVQAHYAAYLYTNLEKVEKGYNQNSEEIYNTANRLIHLIDEDSELTSEKESLIHEIQESIAVNLSDLNKLTDLFLLDLKTNLDQTQDLLNIRVILDSPDLLDKSTLKPVQISRFAKWIKQQQQAFIKAKNDIISFINKQQQELNTQLSKEAYADYSNKIEQTHLFLTRQKPHPKVDELLPFYYKKLFTGAHLLNSNIEERIEYKTAQQALKRIQSGVNGAIMIIGASLSGKTFLSEAIARIPTNLLRYDINPPVQQSYTPADLHQAFQKLFNKKGTSLSILRRLKPTVFIFNDLEKWFTRETNGGKTINYLASLIEKVGSKHIFILNANIHSFGVLKQTTTIEKQLVSTLVMHPFSKIELKRIILNRHKIGGANILYKNELVEESKGTIDIIQKLHKISEGSIGVALHRWLSIISINKDKELIITQALVNEFPKIYNPEWKVLLYAFIIHKSLKEEQIKLLFRDSSNLFFSSLGEMEKAGLVSKQADAAYVLDDKAVFFIEKHLKSLSIL